MSVSMLSVLGLVCGLSSTCLYMSPVATFVGICKDKSTGPYSVLPYALTWVVNALWISYALVVPGRLVLAVSNSIGFTMQTAFCFIFLQYTSDRRRTFATIMGACVLLSLLLTITFMLDFEAPEVVLGYFANIMSVASYMAPLAALKQVVASRDSSCMPLLVSVLTTLSSCLWTVDTYLQSDYFVMMPSVAGVIFGVLQLSVKFAYMPEKISKVSLSKPLLAKFAAVDLADGYESDGSNATLRSTATTDTIKYVSIV